MTEVAPYDFYQTFQNSPEAEGLDLSTTDFGWVAVAFIANGGGTPEEFLEWLRGLSYEDAQQIARN